MSPELSMKYRAELERLDAEYAHYEQQWSKVPRFAWVALSGPSAGLLFGWAAAVVALLVSAALVGTRAYLIAMRKSEIRWNRERLLDDLGALEDGLVRTSFPAAAERGSTLGASASALLVGRG